MGCFVDDVGDFVGDNIGTISNVVGVLDVIPVGNVPIIGQSLGEGLDFLAYATTELAISLSDCDNFTKGLSRTANGANLTAGTVGNLSSFFGDTQVAFVEAGLLAEQNRLMNSC